MSIELVEVEVPVTDFEEMCRLLEEMYGQRAADYAAWPYADKTAKLAIRARVHERTSPINGMGALEQRIRQQRGYTYY